MPVSGQELMIHAIKAEAISAAPWVGAKELSSRVLDVMAQIPRHEFVPLQLCDAAYSNSPLPIGHGQTISQPYIVALMTDLLRLQATDIVLEIGTGSGYQAAVLSRLAKQVYSIEIVEPLADEARRLLHRLGYDNVEVVLGNGRDGLKTHAPYDAIIVTAASENIPITLVEQLKTGGRMVIPIGDEVFGQDLTLLEKNQQNQLISHNVLPVAFVPLVEGISELSSTIG